MNEEVGMRTGSKEMNDTIAAGRRTIELAEGEIDESAWGLHTEPYED